MRHGMKKAALREAEVIPRDYGLMRMLAGGRNLKTYNGDLRILEIEPGQSTSRHFHAKSESIFHVLSGNLEMEVNDELFTLCAGDTMVIEPLEIHLLRNSGSEKATVVETMAPPFSSKDIYYSERQK